MALNFEKLRAAVHYICEKAQEHEGRFDNVKLNKVLWYSDVHHYLKHGAPITGDTYIRKPRGPVAKRNRTAIAMLEKLGSLKHGKAGPDGVSTVFWADRYDVIHEADKTPFTGEELAIIDDVFKKVVLDSTSDEISEQTHGDVWKLAKKDEEIPLYTAFAENLGALTPAQVLAATADLR